MEEAIATTGLAGGSRVRLRRLSERRDGDGWVIGRIDTGDFISVPDVAHRVITLLGQGHAIEEVEARLRAETGRSFAVAGFVGELDGLGFIAAVDGQDREESAPARPSLPSLLPGHVRWLLHPFAPVVPAVFAVTVLVLLVTRHSLLPSYHLLVWNPRPGLVLAVNAAIAWAIILVHELAHLATARAAGAPSRITLSTRLQFLVAQTDVSGVWAAPRRIRMTVYLAGMAADVCSAGTCLLIIVLADPHGLVRSLLAVAAAETLLALPAELMVFMRTDVYFVLQDLTGCANLYADGSAYLRYLGRRVARRAGRTGAVGRDPSRDYPPRQGRAVRFYSVVLLAGTAVCLAVEFAVTVPALIVLVARAIAESGTSPAATSDGGVVQAVLLAWLVLWSSRWWHRHRPQVRSLARTFLREERR